MVVDLIKKFFCCFSFLFGQVKMNKILFYLKSFASFPYLRSTMLQHVTASVLCPCQSLSFPWRVFPFSFYFVPNNTILVKTTGENINNNNNKQNNVEAKKNFKWILMNFFKKKKIEKKIVNFLKFT